MRYLDFYLQDCTNSECPSSPHKTGTVSRLFGREKRSLYSTTYHVGVDHEYIPPRLHDMHVDKGAALLLFMRRLKRTIMMHCICPQH